MLGGKLCVLERRRVEQGLKTPAPALPTQQRPSPHCSDHCREGPGTLALDTWVPGLPPGLLSVCFPPGTASFRPLWVWEEERKGRPGFQKVPLSPGSSRSPSLARGKQVLWACFGLGLDPSSPLFSKLMWVPTPESGRGPEGTGEEGGAFRAGAIDSSLCRLALYLCICLPRARFGTARSRETIKSTHVCKRCPVAVVYCWCCVFCHSYVGTGLTLFGFPRQSRKLQCFCEPVIPPVSPCAGLRLFALV